MGRDWEQIFNVNSDVLYNRERASTSELEERGSAVDHPNESRTWASIWMYEGRVDSWRGGYPSEVGVWPERLEEYPTRTLVIDPGSIELDDSIYASMDEEFRASHREYIQENNELDVVGSPAVLVYLMEMIQEGDEVYIEAPAKFVGVENDNVPYAIRMESTTAKAHFENVLEDSLPIIRDGALEMAEPLRNVGRRILEDGSMEEVDKAAKKGVFRYLTAIMKEDLSGEPWNAARGAYLYLREFHPEGRPLYDKDDLEEESLSMMGNIGLEFSVQALSRRMADIRDDVLEGKIPMSAIPKDEIRKMQSITIDLGNVAYVKDYAKDSKLQNQYIPQLKSELEILGLAQETGYGFKNDGEVSRHIADIEDEIEELEIENTAFAVFREIQISDKLDRNKRRFSKD